MMKATDTCKQCKHCSNDERNCPHQDCWDSLVDPLRLSATHFVAKSEKIDRKEWDCENCGNGFYLSGKPCTDAICQGSIGRGDETPSGWVGRLCNNCEHGPAEKYLDRKCFTNQRLPHWAAIIEPEKGYGTCLGCANHPDLNNSNECPHVDCSESVHAGKGAPMYHVVKITKSSGPIAQAIAKGGCNLDPWKHRTAGMTCKTCMWFCNMRCRKHAPTMGGYPAVYETDWCGDHKLDKAAMGGE